MDPITRGPSHRLAQVSGVLVADRAGLAVGDYTKMYRLSRNWNAMPVGLS